MCAAKLNVIRERLIICLQNANFGLKQKIIDRILELNNSTSLKYRQKYLRNNIISDPRVHRSGRKSKCDNGMLIFLRNFFTRNPTSTTKDSKNILRQELPMKPHISDSALYKTAVKNLNFDIFIFYPDDNSKNGVLLMY